MSPFIGEIIGTALLIILGDGVVANAILKQTKGNGSGWIVITFGWGMAVFVAVFTVASVSGAHINPAVTIGLAAAGKFPWASVPIYLAGQMIGGAIGAFLVWLHYRQHFGVTNEPGVILGVFATAPEIRSNLHNMISEIIGTFVLVFGVLYLAKPEVGLGALDALPVGLLVFSIGLSLGGTTGYAINPARDLAPRIMHAVLPISGKGSSDWSYSWIPVLGPIAGSILAAILYLVLGKP